ncbi:MAG: hypothetical protein A07HR60_02162 [uncultured archaeon A07HR60]|nr:MAG: hypothetical protein A07HR60_02162 [uncultured archaeon A07HR60]
MQFIRMIRDTSVRLCYFKRGYLDRQHTKPCWKPTLRILTETTKSISVRRLLYQAVQGDYLGV